MLYEISRESFKKRIERPEGFEIFDLSKEDQGVKNAVFAGGQAKADDLIGKIKNNKGNILLFSFDSGSNTPEIIAKDLAEKDLPFVFYYLGNPEDKILDKGLN